MILPGAELHSYDKQTREIVCLFYTFASGCLSYASSVSSVCAYKHVSTEDVDIQLTGHGILTVCLPWRPVNGLY